MGFSVTDRMAFLTRAMVPWRPMVAAALLSLLLGAAVSQGLTGERSSVVPAAHSRVLGKRLSSLPLSAQGPVSEALGANDPGYRISASPGGFRAVSPSQGLAVRFGHSGVALSSGTVRLELSLRAVGYGTSLQALGDVSPRVTANRVIYAHPALSQWYVNGPLGLEQGFTVPRAPARLAPGPLTLSMSVSGDVHASLAADGRSLTLTHAAGHTLRYGSLVATDARGRILHSWLELRAGQVQLRVDTRGARYPLRIDPFIQQGPRLTGSGLAGLFPEFGPSVAISADGNTALIGAPQDNNVGAAWVFTRAGGVWTQQGGKLIAKVGEEIGEGHFAASVALSSDGNTALIGAFFDNAAVGAAWVFTRSGSTWTQQGAKLTAKGGEEIGEGLFGRSVALSSDGNTALIGGDGDNTRVGAAWAFTRSGSTWTQQGAKLTAKGGEEIGEGFFGLSVALSSDGNTALIGGDGDNSSAGAAWVFTRSGSTWTQQGAKLTAKGGEETGAGVFGSSVALSSDGNTGLIGGSFDNTRVGAAWVFTRSGSTWTQQGAKLTGNGESGEGRFGESVALSSDGNAALIGGPTDHSNAGAVWVFNRSGASWSQQGAKLVGGSEETLSGDGDFGVDVALSADGNTALIAGEDENKASVFVNPPPTVTTGAASGVGASTATLNGTVNAGASNTAYFQYGTTPAYGASTAGQSVGASTAASPLVATVSGLSPGTTYHFRLVAENSGGTSFGADQTFTTATEHTVVPPVAVPPIITSATQSNHLWREGAKLAHISKRRKPPVGTTFSFTLNEQASVTFAFTQRVGGRTVNHKCVAQTKKNRHKHGCKRTVTPGTMTFTGHPGTNKVSFQGRLSRSKKLGLGSYTLAITATNAAGQHSSTKQLSFTIVK
jgi:FG-GAP repeat